MSDAVFLAVLVTFGVTTFLWIGVASLVRYFKNKKSIGD